MLQEPLIIFFDRSKNKIKAKDTDEIKTTLLQLVIISNVDRSFP